MKILIFSPDFLPNTGGIAVFVHNICLQLVRLGHEVDVLTTRKIANHSDKPYKVYQYDPSGRLSSMKAILAVFSLYLKRRYDLLFFGHFVSMHALGAILLKKIFKVPYIVLCHGKDIFDYGVPTVIDIMARRIVINKASIVLANSNYTKAKIIKELDACFVDVLNPGVDCSIFTQHAKSERTANNESVILSVGRLEKRKNHMGVLEAIKIVIKTIPNIKYRIVGKGDEKKAIEEYININGLSGHVNIIENITSDMLPACYGDSDIFVMPSLDQDKGENYEGFGIVFLEAGACGKPVIGSKTGGISDAVIDNETGILVNDPSNAREISDAILYLLNNKQIADEMGKKARERILKYFDWAIVGDKLSDILEKMNE